MNVASAKLCNQLYLASLRKWTDTDYRWYDDNGYFVTEKKLNGLWVPAYDLGYLLRKLPVRIDGKNSREREGRLNLCPSFSVKSGRHWLACYADKDDSVVKRKKLDAESNNHRNFWYVQFSGTTPEDATCKLAIELFKQGVIR